MKRIFRWAAALLVAAAACAVQAQSCSPIAGSATATVVDIWGAAVDVQGSLTFSCTRPAGNPRFPSTFWIGASGVNGSRNLASGTNPLGYSLFTDYAGCTTPWSGATGATVANALTANGDTTLTNVTATFCFRINGGQTTAKPLTFTGTETLQVRSLTNTGFLWGSGTLTLQGTVNSLCKFTTAAGTLTMNYTSFQAAASTSTNAFDVSCTNSTPYSLALDATGGTVLGLNYSVGLNAVGTQTLGSLLGTGGAQSYSFMGSIAAGQSGTCAVGSGCTANDPRTITVTY